MRAYYLQLHFDVWDDPAIRMMPAQWRCAILDLMKYAVRSSEPGIISMSVASLAKCCGFRNLARFEAFLELLEERRLIAFRKEDDAICLNPDLIPQAVGGENAEQFPRRRKPSETRAAMAERQRKSRAAKQLQFTPDITPSSHPNITDTSKQSEAKEQHQQAAGENVTPHANADADDSPLRDPETRTALILEGIQPRIADNLIDQHGADQCRQQLAYLPLRSVTNKAAALVSAIAEHWEAPAAHTIEAARQEAEAEAQAQRQRAQNEADWKRAQAASRAANLDAWRDHLTDKQRASLTAEAIAQISATARDLYRAGKHSNPILRAELDAAEYKLLSERQTDAA